MDCFWREVGSETECEIMPKGYREYGEELDYLSIRIFPEQKKKLRDSLRTYPETPEVN